MILAALFLKLGMYCLFNLLILYIKIILSNLYKNLSSLFLLLIWDYY